MKRLEPGTCPDCGTENVKITSQGICARCRTRKVNMRNRGKEYIPYLKLSKSEQQIISMMQDAQNTRKRPTIENVDNASPAQHDFIQTLRDCGCEISEENLNDVLNVLSATDKLKDLILTIATDENQQALLDLEQSLNAVERKLQHDWEYNGFQPSDDLKFKTFLTWRRTTKGAIFFWKKLYQSNMIIELQRAWNSYSSDPTNKIIMAGDRMESKHKRFQISTDSISTIFNTRRPFTRVFYAASKEDAYIQFTKWMAERQLHEDKSKTTITELKPIGEDGRGDNND